MVHKVRELEGSNGYDARSEQYVDLEAAGVPIIGTSPDAIDRAEDRERFQQLIESKPQPLDLLQLLRSNRHPVVEVTGCRLG